MSRLAAWLRRWPVLLAFFVAMVLTGLSFSPVQQAIDGQLLDMIWSGDAAKARLAELSSDQRTAHLFGTLINDTLYPLAYAGFFAGLAARFAPPRWQALTLVPAFTAAIVDLCENTVQALALSGTASMLDAKTVLTPLKFGLVAVAILLSILLAGLSLVRFLLRRSASRH